jgi:hypothetical protein
MPFIDVTMTFMVGNMGWRQGANHSRNLDMNKYLERLKNDFQGGAERADCKVAGGGKDAQS